MQGICVGPEAVQVKGNCKRYQCWGDRIYIKRDIFTLISFLLIRINSHYIAFPFLPLKNECSVNYYPIIHQFYCNHRQYKSRVIVSDTSAGETGYISKETGLGQLWTRTME
jgi:hypothetical protein